MPVANVSTQYHETGNVSFKAQGAVTGKTFVQVAADRTGGPGLSTDLQNLYVMKTCVAATKAAGVAKYDVADTKTGGIHGQPGMIVPVTAGGTINAGQEVEVGAGGKAVAFSAGIKVGMAMSGAVNLGDAQIKLY